MFINIVLYGPLTRLLLLAKRISIRTLLDCIEEEGWTSGWDEICLLLAHINRVIGAVAVFRKET